MRIAGPGDLRALGYGWRDQLLAAGQEIAGKEERQGQNERGRKIAELERTRR